MSAPIAIDPGLYDFCTPRQREVLEAIDRLGSGRGAAIELGVNATYPGGVFNDVRRKAARQGYAPGHFEHGVAPGFAMGKATVQRGASGAVERVWERQHPDGNAEERLAGLTERLEERLATLTPLAPRTQPAGAAAALLNLFTITDFHLGMQAWHKEGGADWDLKIAVGVFTAAIAQMIAGVPKAGSAILDLNGDLNHTDGHKPLTPEHHHVLDADGRFEKVADALVDMIIAAVMALLETHERVTVLPLEGNHDPSTMIWLRVMLARVFANEPRVEVVRSPLPYVAIQHGKTMLAFHHGHLRKNDSLPLLFAAQFPAIWGATVYRYAHTGHRHHHEEKEHSGMTVVQHQTLAARDAHAARGGWISERGANAITYHAEFGEVGRITVRPEMLAA